MSGTGTAEGESGRKDAIHKWTASFTGIDPAAAAVKAAPPGGGGSAGLSPDQAAACTKYLSDHDFRAGTLQLSAVKPGDYQPMLDGHFTSLDKVAAAVAQGTGAEPSPALRSLVKARFDAAVAQAISAATKSLMAGSPPAMSQPRRPAPSAGGDAPAKAGGGDDDGPEVSVSVDPASGTAKTEITYTIKLRAVDEQTPPVIQLLPEQQITVSIEDPHKPPSIEAQLTIVKADLTQLLEKAVNLKGKIKIEATVGVSVEMDTAKAAVGKIAQSLEAKIKAELSIEVFKRVSIKPGLEMGPDGKTVPAIGVELRF